jgi:MiaB/RimO family radical SAM methylthiotransferase
MNVNDSDIVRRLLSEAGFEEVDSEIEAHLLLTNTCAIREGAEQKVWQRLRDLKAKRRKRNIAARSSSRKDSIDNPHQKVVIGVLGCMAERLKEDLFREGSVDLVVGPDAYRDLPQLALDLLDVTSMVENAVQVQLSLDETYADISPIRRQNADDVSAFCSIQRGCANRCSFCIVPFTRGQERSRPLTSVLDEITRLHLEEGVQEVTLLGQNVNSYHDKSESALFARPASSYTMSNPGFHTRIRRTDAGYFFADLLEQVSEISSELRVRFTSPHPKDYPPELLDLMADRPNICNHLHMPAQSGSTSMLQRMKRGYTREAYLQLLDDVKSKIPDVGISSDFIAGFCDETEDEHQETLSLMEQVRYDQAYMFAYSMRGKTHAHRTMQDNIPEDIKQRRLRELIDMFQTKVQEKNAKQEVGRLRLVLLEGEAKRSAASSRSWSGRTDQNKRVVFPVDNSLTAYSQETIQPMIQAIKQHGLPTAASLVRDDAPRVELKKGDYAVVEITEARGQSLRGQLLWRSSIGEFAASGLSGMGRDSLELGEILRSILHSKDVKFSTKDERQMMTQSN